MNIKIQEVDKLEINLDKVHVEPEVIFNRPDKEDKECVLLNIDERRYLFVEKIDSTVKVGSFLMPIAKQEVKAVNRFLFRKYKDVKEINWKNINIKIGVWRNTYQKVIDLPETVNELKGRLTSKNRYNLRREQRLVKENIGDFRIDIYEKAIPEYVIEKYFKLKQITHKCDYNMSPHEYLKTYSVSTAYVMRTDEEILAILFSCEQCETVYFENFTYDTRYSKYSLGSIIYDFFLESLVTKKKRAVFLGGGEYEYKKKYGSREIHAYVCKVYRLQLKNFYQQGKKKFNYYKGKLKTKFI